MARRRATRKFDTILDIAKHKRPPCTVLELAELSFRSVRQNGKTIQNIRIIEDLSQNQDSGDQNLAILTEEDHLEHHQESLREVDHLEKPARTDLCQKTRLTLP